MKKALILLIVLAVSFGFSSDTVITVKGSDTLVILAQRWAEVYMSKHSGVKIQVTGCLLYTSRCV